VQQAKRALTGRGNALKPEMMDAARALGLKIEHHDEADAAGVWLHALQTLQPDLAAKFRPPLRLRG
jgi:Holliday junction resolvasome RuvABC endonuclease subunit